MPSRSKMHADEEEGACDGRGGVCGRTGGWHSSGQPPWA